MAITHKSQIETSISRLRETAYNIARTNADDFRRIISEQPGVAMETLQFEDDAGYENGSDLAIDTWATTADTSIEISPKLNFQDIGYQLDRALGGYAVSGPDGAGIYTHTFTPQSMNTSRQLPSSTFLKKYGGLRTVLYPGMVCGKLSITGGKNGRLTTSQSFMGSGDRTKNPTGYTSPALTSDREYAYAGQATIELSEAALGTRQVETATVAGTISAAGSVSVIIDALTLITPVSIDVPVLSGDTASQVAAKIRQYLRANSFVGLTFDVTGNGTAIVLTKRAKAANDTTLNIALATGTATGLTAAPTSVNTTAGVVGVSQNYSCMLESWNIDINNPSADDGYRQCAPYVVPGNPLSGQMRSEYLVGMRDYTFGFSARDNGLDRAQDWLRAGTTVDLRVPILGIETDPNSLVFTHTRARVVQANPMLGAGGDFIGVEGSVRLLAGAAGDGSIPFTAVLQNRVVSYAS